MERGEKVVLTKRDRGKKVEMELQRYMRQLMESATGKRLELQVEGERMEMVVERKE